MNKRKLTRPNGSLSGLTLKGTHHTENPQNVKLNNVKVTVPSEYITRAKNEKASHIVVQGDGTVGMVLYHAFTIGDDGIVSLDMNKTNQLNELSNNIAQVNSETGGFNFAAQCLQNEIDIALRGTVVFKQPDESCVVVNQTNPQKELGFKLHGQSNVSIPAEIISVAIKQEASHIVVHYVDDFDLSTYLAFHFINGAVGDIDMDKTNRMNNIQAATMRSACQMGKSNLSLQFTLNAILTELGGSVVYQPTRKEQGFE